jgi:hypothetical protein
LNASLESLLDVERRSMTSYLELSEEEEKMHQQRFCEQMELEIAKVDFFFAENLKFYKNKLNKINDQLNHIKKNKHLKNFKDNLEIGLKELYKEVILMRQFVELNIKAKLKIMKKYQKFTKFCKRPLEVAKIIDDFIANKTKLKDPLKLISEIQSELEKIFYNNFFDKYSFHAGKILKDYINPIYFTQTQSFYFGFSCGILCILLFLCVLIGNYFNIDMDDDAEFKSIFPIFRGFLIICIYLWLLGLNVYAWNKANINYYLCFSFKNHYSDVISICRRAATFTSLLVLMILCYMILRTKILILSELISFIPLEFTPLICWIFLIIYLFFPFDFFNLPGRIYLFTILIESCSSIFMKLDFRHIWFTDQLTSMIGPLRDIEYSVCYYTHWSNTFEERKLLCSGKRTLTLLIAIFPHILRTLQCFRAMYDSKKFFPQIINSGKYLTAILVAITSFFASNYLLFNNIWWLFALISTIYSFIWDLKMDFGFLEHGPNYPLREKLSYKNKFFYYMCCIVNLFLRFMWILTVSPEIVYRFIRPEFFSFIIYSFEVFRRGMWNFIRVEFKHIEICKEFRVTLDIELPFKKTEKGEFVLKNAPLVEYNKINKRMEKMKSSKFMGDLNNHIQSVRESINSKDKIFIQNSNEKNNPSLSFIKNSKFSTEYDSSDFRKGLNNYLQNFNKMTIVVDDTKLKRPSFLKFPWIKNNSNTN